MMVRPKNTARKLTSPKKVLEEGKDEEEENKEESVFLAPSESLDNTLAPCRGFERTESQGVRRIMEGNMVSFMGSLVYDWLLNAGDEKLAKKFKKEANPEPLPPNSPRLADIVKHYKETTPQKRKAEPVVNGSAKKAKKVVIIAKLHIAPTSLSSRCKALG